MLGIMSFMLSLEYSTLTKDLSDDRIMVYIGFGYCGFGS